MKLKKILFSLFLIPITNNFAMNEETLEPDSIEGDESMYFTPIKMIRTETDINYGDYLNNYQQLKKNFNEAVSNEDLDGAQDFLNKIEDIFYDSGLRIGNPKVKKEIEDFLESVEVDDFRIAYRLYKNGLKRKLIEYLVGKDKKDKQVIPKDVVEISYEYLYPEKLEIKKLLS